MTAREGELKACESFEEFIDEATVSVYLSEEDREVLEGNLLPLWGALNTRAADPRIAELEVENARLDKQNANLDSLLSSSIKLSDKHEAVNCDLHLRVEKLEAENAMLKQKLDESDALFHASLPDAPEKPSCEKCKAMLDKVKTFHGKITGREGMTFEQFFKEVGNCVEIVDKYSGQELEHMEIAMFETRLKALFDELTKPLEFPSVLWDDDGTMPRHPLTIDESILQMNDGSWHVIWGCGITKYATLKEAQDAITESYHKWWNRIHALPEVGGKEEG